MKYITVIFTLQRQRKGIRETNMESGTGQGTTLVVSVRSKGNTRYIKKLKIVKEK